MAFSYLQTTQDTGDKTTYTFSSQNLGTAASDRVIIVGIAARKAGAATTISSVTVGGVTASIPVSYSNSDGNSNISGIAVAEVPTGTTGDIVVTFGAGMVRAVITAWRATSLASTTPHDSLTDGSTDPTGTIDIPAGGFAVATALSNSVGTTTWTGLTEHSDATLESFVTVSDASDEFVSTQTGRTITADFTGSGSTPTMSVASFEVSTGTDDNDERDAKVTGQEADSDTRAVKMWGAYSGPQYLYWTKINSGSNSILTGIVTEVDATTPGNSSIAWHLSNDGGSSWESVTAGSAHTFVSSGTDLRARATLNASSDGRYTPTLNEVSFAWTEGAGGTTTSSTRSAKISGTDTDNSTRSSKITGTSTDNSSRSAKVTGSDTGNSERNAVLAGSSDSLSTRNAKITGLSSGGEDERASKITGSESVDADEWVVDFSTISSTRPAKVVGLDTDNGERAAKVHGQELTNDSRSAKISGKDSTSDTRSATIHGQTTNEDERSSTIHGQQQDSDIRSAKIRGQDSDNDSRPAKISGIETLSNTRSAKIVGLGGDGSSVPGKIVGEATDNNERSASILGGLNNERSAFIDGKDTDTSSRSAFIDGKAIGTSDTQAKIVGKDTSNDQRSATIDGQDNTEDEKQAKIHGKTTGDNQRSAKIRGKDTSSDTRSAMIDGKDSDGNSRSAKIHGQTTGSDEISAKIRGQELDSDERSGKIHGQTTGSSNAQAKITGQDTDSSERSAKIEGTFRQNDQRSAKIIGAEEVSDERGATILGDFPAPITDLDVDHGTGMPQGITDVEIQSIGNINITDIEGITIPQSLCVDMQGSVQIINIEADGRVVRVEVS